MVDDEHVHVGRDVPGQIGLRERLLVVVGKSQVVEGQSLGGGQRFVGSPVEEGTHRDVGDDVGYQEPGDQKNRHDGDQPPLQGHVSRGSRRVYPTRRMVWISAGSTMSIFLRRYEM